MFVGEFGSESSEIKLGRHAFTAKCFIEKGVRTNWPCMEQQRLADVVSRGNANYEPIATAAAETERPIPCLVDETPDRLCLNRES